MNTKRLLIAASEKERDVITQAGMDYCSEVIADDVTSWEHVVLPDSPSILFLDPTHHPALYESLPHYLVHFSSVILLSETETQFESADNPKLVSLQKPLASSSVEAHLAYLRTQQTFHALHGQSKLLGLMFTHASMPLILTDTTTFGTLADEAHLLLNPAATHLLGRGEKQGRTLDWTQLFHPEDSATLLAGVADLHTGRKYTQEVRYKHPDGSYRVLLLTVITVGSWYLCTIKPSEVENNRMLSQLKAMSFRCKADERGTLLALSEGCKPITGYSATQLASRSLNELIVPSYRACIRMRRTQALAEKKTTTLAYEIQTASNGLSNVLEISHGIYTTEGALTAVEGILLSADDENTIEHFRSLDSSTRLKTGEYLKNLFTYDATEHLTNRRALVHLNLSMIHTHTVVHGFAHSQRILNQVATQLKQYSNDTCILCKTFENHYTFYLKNYACRQTLLDFCRTLSTQMNTLLRSEGFPYGIGLLELAEQQACAYEESMHRAMIASDEALRLKYQRFGYCEYSEELEQQSNRKKTLITELGEIVAGTRTERLYVLFQPIVTLATNRITEFEVLARLDSDLLGPVSPVEFIPLAEQTKYIIDLGYLIIGHALHFLQTLHDQGWKEINISINVSSVQLMEADFVPRLLSLIEASSISCSHICLEITESSLMTNFEEINELLAELKQSGITIALDDFGTGYSSLAYERLLKVDALKIDKVFIDGLIADEPCITENIISMAHKLGHMVIAEGVQTAFQNEYLYKHGCDKIQGFLVNTPLSLQNALDFLHSYEQNPR